MYTQQKVIETGMNNYKNTATPHKPFVKGFFGKAI
jgi:hypothetical protein